MPGIIVGVDGSDHSGHALRWAMQEAARRHAPLTVMTVCPSPARPATAATTPSPAPQRENSSIADVKSSVKANYEEDDLDVPAFIRKRNENQ